MLYCADWASVLIIDLEWTGGTVQQPLQNTLILNTYIRHYDKHNQQIFQALCLLWSDSLQYIGFSAHFPCAKQVNPSLMKDEIRKYQKLGFTGADT